MMSESMVERVARAIGETCRPPGSHLITPGTLLAARAAIAAMREPTRAMKTQGAARLPMTLDDEAISVAGDSFTAMIDAALSEPKGE